MEQSTIITKISIEGRIFSIYEKNGLKKEFNIDELETIFIKNNKTKWLVILFSLAVILFLIYLLFLKLQIDLIVVVSVLSIASYLVLLKMQKNWLIINLDSGDNLNFTISNKLKNSIIKKVKRIQVLSSQINFGKTNRKIFNA